MYYHKASKQQETKVGKHLFFYIIIGIVFSVSIIIMGGCNSVILNSSSESEIKQLTGVYIYDESAKYEFDGNGNGCMCIDDEYHYDYTYTVVGNQLKLDFKAEEVHDATYNYILDGDLLTLVGKEGTAGGTYILKKN